MAFRGEFSLLKSAGEFPEAEIRRLQDDAKFLEKVSATGTLARVAPFLASALGLSALTGAFGYWSAKQKYDSRTQDIKNSYDALLKSHKDFSKNPSLFNQRFSELSLISPTVASNPRLAHQIILPRMEKGFDLDDVHRLSSIEYHRVNTPPVLHPIEVGKTQAMNTLMSQAGIYMPSIINTITSPDPSRSESKMRSIVKGTVQDENKRMREEIKKQRGGLTEEKANENAQAFAQKANAFSPEMMAANREKLINAIMKKNNVTREQAEADVDKAMNMKKHSSANGGLRVSEECLGRMLADRYCMYKTAAPITTEISKFLKPGMDAMAKHMKVMAIPLAIAGGVTLVNQIMKNKENQKIRAQADQHFMQLKRTSEVVKSNPDLAHEAFDTLKAISPNLAAKPVVMRTFVENVINTGILPIEQAKSLAQTEEKILSNAENAGSGGFIEGLKGPMSIFNYSYSSGDKSKGGGSRSGGRSGGGQSGGKSGKKGPISSNPFGHV